MSSYELILPMPPNRLNSRGHWRIHQRRREEYYVLCNQALVGVKANAVANGGNFPLLKAQWHAIFHLRQAMDFDNLVARLKWPLDYLKEHGWFVDDGPDNLWPKQLPYQHVISGKGASKIKERLIFYLYDDS